MARMIFEAKTRLDMEKRELRLARELVEARKTKDERTEVRRRIEESG